MPYPNCAGELVGFVVHLVSGGIACGLQFPNRFADDSSGVGGQLLQVPHVHFPLSGVGEHVGQDAPCGKAKAFAPQHGVVQAGEVLLLSVDSVNGLHGSCG